MELYNNSFFIIGMYYRREYSQKYSGQQRKHKLQ